MTIFMFTIAVLSMGHLVSVDVDIGFCVSLEIVTMGIHVEMGPFI